MCTGVYACAPNHHKMKYKCCMRLVLGVWDNHGTNHYHLLTVYYMLGAVLSTWYAWSQFNPHNNPVMCLHVRIQSPQRLKKWLKVTVLESDRKRQDWIQEHFDSKSPYSQSLKKHFHMLTLVTSSVYEGKRAGTSVERLLLTKVLCQNISFHPYTINIMAMFMLTLWRNI